MKKLIIALVVLVMVLCAGCAKQEPAPVETTAPAAAPTEAPTEATVPPTTEETIPAPALANGSAMVDKTPAVLDTLMRNDVVDVVGEYDEDHYVIKTAAGYGLVQKELVRMNDEPAYEVWTGYSYWHAEVYETFHLTGEPVLLNQNTHVEVLDDLGYCYVVRVDGSAGFMKKAQISKWSFNSGGNSGSSGGHGGSTGADGGDISLQFQGGITLLSAVEQSGDVIGQAVVLADGAEVILGYFDRGDQIPMVAEEGFAEEREGFVAVYLNGLYAYVPQALVLAEDAEPYEEWDGYSYWNGVVYDNFYLLGDPIDKLHSNVKVHILAELENCYLVETNGNIGYMSKDVISKTHIPTGGSNRNSGGHGGGSGDWTPPAL